MGELLFPIAAMVVLFMVAVPICTIGAKLALVGLRRVRPERWRAGSWTRYALLVTPVVGPIAWFISAAVHHAEPGIGDRACLWDEVLCLEPILLLFLVVGTTTAVALRRGAAARRAIVRTPRVADRRLEARLKRLRERHRVLESVSPVIVQGDGIRTVGLLSPTIEVGTSLAARLDDEALMGALLHEAAHREAHDPMRFVVAMICQTLNPLRRLLEPELAQWRVGREQACDRQAVHVGGHPLALAEAIVIAARQRATPAEPAGLAGHGVAAIRERVALLFGYLDRPPGCTCSKASLYATLLAAVLLAVVPHAVDAWPLLDLHVAMETALVEIMM